MCWRMGGGMFEIDFEYEIFNFGFVLAANLLYLLYATLQISKKHRRYCL